MGDDNAAFLAHPPPPREISAAPQIVPAKNCSFIYPVLVIP